MIHLDGSSLTSQDVISIINGNSQIELSENARSKVEKAREAVDEIVTSGRPAYGINTGFGDLVSVAISSEDLTNLQENLVRSHACGMGESMDPAHVLGMMTIRVNSLLVGNSGIRWSTIQTLVSMIQARIAPVVPRIGSLGASGDLAPLSHMSLGLMGEGMVDVNNGNTWVRMDASKALSDAGIEPIKLAAKEGLSLINGTSQMCVWLCIAYEKISSLISASEVALALSIEAVHASVSPFDERIHSVRPHKGQLQTASRIRYLLSESSNMESHADCEKVQDAYSFRCSPQVIGAVRDVLDNVNDTLSIELNSVTDNPLIFVSDESVDVVSGGNFHGEILGMRADSAHLAIHELASISERRIAKLLDPSTTGLPAFLAEDPGLNSGLMILQYSAAAAISEIRATLGPATATNIVVSGQQEDHVSMGATASWLLVQSISNAASVIAAEMISASIALDLRTTDIGPNLQPYLNKIRSFAPVEHGDVRRDIEVRNLIESICDGSYN
ncbi:MAG: histidine ammonia-lyase [Euryarchaeota archaeon]|nr:histidine ammonia-lyase [Euryarchaeota archaeon]|tara:strand:- start:607 stop:2112 length:1506 start_codon:yes stop_codon:yes gene_type:complete